MTRATGQTILILGMHRSGTSYLANLMESLGVFIGDKLVGPQKGNPRGHFEAVPVLEFHQKLMTRHLGPDRRAFDDGMLVQQPMETEVEPGEKEAAARLLEELRRPGPWGWKEPRTCLFLDLWTQLLPEAGAVAVYRHPLEIQQSLLRREHWDLALFPDQAMRAFVTYNREILRHTFPQRFVFNANAGFSDVAALAGGLCDTFDLKQSGTAPEFHAEEFHSVAVSEPLHELTRLVFPDAAETFDALQRESRIPFSWQARDDDARLQEISKNLEPVLSDLPPEGRAWFAPLLDWLAAGRDPSIFGRYIHLGEEIGGRVQRVEEWNRQAAVIYKENERLAADYKRMGTEFARQQEFLGKQKETQAKLWSELSRTGQSWKEQRQLIDRLIAEKRGLEEQLRKREEEDGS